MRGMEFWLATVYDDTEIYQSEVIWCDGDRETAWSMVSRHIRDLSLEVGHPVRLDGPFVIAE